MFHVLNDDELVNVFLILFICSNANDPFNFVQTCKRFAAVFGVNANGTGSIHYVNFLYSKKVRCSSHAEKVDKVLNIGFKKQLEFEKPFHDMVRSFMKADSVNAMHCSSSCCERSRKTFNENVNRKYKLVGMLPTVRCVCVATDPEGNPVEFSLYSAFGGKIFLSKTLRDKDSGKVLCETTVNETELPTLDKHVDSISCSPCGKYLVYRRSAPTRTFFCWNTTLTTEATLAVNQICDMEKLLIDQLKIPFLAYSINPMHVWWAQDSTMFIAWKIVAAGTAYVSYPQHGFAITALDVDSKAQRSALFFEYGIEFNLTFSEWFVIKSQLYARGDTSMIVYDFSGGPDNIKTSYVSCLAKDNDLLGQASHELFRELSSCCISKDGTKLAVFCYACDHEYRQRPNAPANVDISDDFMLMVLFTRSTDGKFYYRQNGQNDECFLPYHSDIQACPHFEIAFSPCNSIIQVIYSPNKFIQTYNNNTSLAFPSAYFVRINSTKIQRTTPIVNTKVRAFCWDNKSLIVLPKHGCVRLVPK